MLVSVPQNYGSRQPGLQFYFVFVAAAVVLPRRVLPRRLAAARPAGAREADEVDLPLCASGSCLLLPKLCRVEVRAPAVCHECAAS